MLRKWRKNTNLFATIIIYINYQKIVRWWDGGPCLSKKLCLLFFLLTNFLEQVFWRAPLSFLDAYMVSSSYHRSVKKKNLQSDLVFFAVSYSKEEITFQWSSIFTEEADKNKRGEKGEGTEEVVFDEEGIIVSDQQPSLDAVHLVQVCYYFVIFCPKYHQWMVKGPFILFNLKLPLHHILTYF